MKNLFSCINIKKKEAHIHTQIEPETACLKIREQINFLRLLYVKALSLLMQIQVDVDKLKSMSNKLYEITVLLKEI